MSRSEVLRDVKKEMTDKWSEMVSLMTKYETHLKEGEGGKTKGTEADGVRLRVENEELKIKIKVIESKWKSFKDEAIKNEVKLQRRIKQLEGTNIRLKDAIDKMKVMVARSKAGLKRKHDAAAPEDEDDLSDDPSAQEKFGNVRVVTDTKRIRFHQDAIINGKRQRKPKFSHLQSDYAIDMKGMDKKLLDDGDDVLGEIGPDAGEAANDEDDDNFCQECSTHFIDNNSLRRHMREAHGVLNPDATFSCDKCNILLGSAVAYNRHMKYLHGHDEKPFTCDVCHVAFATQQNLQAHLDNKVHEKKGLAQQAKTKALLQQQAKEMETKSSSNSSSPINTPKPEVNVIKVQPKKTGPKPKRNICPLCFMVFPTSASMTEHMQKHRQAPAGPPLSCDHCEEIFYKQTALAEHEARCPKNKSQEDKLWDTIVFPEASQVLEEQANYKDESLIDPELGPTQALQDEVSQPVVAETGVVTGTSAPVVQTTTTTTTETPATPSATPEVTSSVTPAQTTYETVSIVDESGQPLGQAQVSVDPVTGHVTYMAVGQHGEQLPLASVLEGADTSELLLSIINQANNAAKST